MDSDRTQGLFAKFGGGEITREEWDEFCELLGKKYGEFMAEFACPKCKRPLLRTWWYGLVCWHREGGCGWQSSFGSPYAMRQG